MIIRGDCLEAMAQLEAESVDAVVTDPPYGIGFMGHAWDQPGEHGPVRANGQPGAFARGRPYPGPHTVDGAREGVPPGQRRVANPVASGFGNLSAERRRKLGKRAESRARDGAMEAGRYDLSLSANRRFQAWCEAWASEALRVLKPGGHIVVFGSPRTHHRLTCGLEDAGFEIRDTIMWLFGSGFPKSLDVSKAIDAAAGARREVIGTRVEHDITRPEGGGSERLMTSAGNREERVVELTAPATSEAEQWSGWGTALKPAHEPIVIARKPYVGTVAGNVLEHGTAAINIDGCRVGAGVGRWPANVILSHEEGCRPVGERRVRANGHFPAARGPSGYGDAVADSNGGGLKGQDGLEERSFDGELVQEWECVAECAVRLLNEQSGELRSGANPARRNSDKTRGVYGRFDGRATLNVYRGEETGGASRFFYCAKASRAERDAGLVEFLPRARRARKRYQQDVADRWRARAQNSHATVKPIDVMRWVARLVTPPGGRVLDPFAGSGTTGCACALEGFEFVGIEREGQHVAVAEARVRFWREHPTGLPAEQALEADGVRRRTRAGGQLELRV